MKKLLVGVAMTGVLVGGGVVAQAAISPGSGNTLSACYDNGGNLKLIDNGGTCPKGYAGPVTWNKQGIPGTAGADGTNGVSGYEQVSTTVPIHANELSGIGVTSVSCPAGKKVLGGGGSILTLDGALTSGQEIPMSYPLDDDTWNIAYTFSNPLRIEMVVTVRATCALAN